MVYQAIRESQLSPEFLLTTCLCSSRPLALALRILRVYRACHFNHPEEAAYWTEKTAKFERFITELLDICSSDEEVGVLLLLDEGTGVLDLAVPYM